MAGKPLQEHYADALLALAERWRDQPYHMGYDLMNEPWPGTDWPTCANPLGCPIHDTTELQPAFDFLTSRLRTVDSLNISWYEPVQFFNNGAPTNMGPVDDPNVGLSWHDYCVVGGALYSRGLPDDAPGCQLLDPVVFDNHAAARDRMGVTALMSEFGASDAVNDIGTMADLADQHLTGWQYWHYKNWRDPTTHSADTATQSLFTDDEDLSTAKVAKLQTLVRTYPQATAGTPQSLSFDPGNGDFRYVYSPRAISAPTLIYVSKLHYPDGFEVEASGAEVTSEPGARIVELQAEPGAAMVEVRITRATGGGA